MKVLKNLSLMVLLALAFAGCRGKSSQLADFNKQLYAPEYASGFKIERADDVLAATGNHEDFDKIEMNISEVEGYINGGEQTDAVSHCRVLGFLFEHLPKNYKFKLENIL